jgi:hypothetical protein
VLTRLRDKNLHTWLPDYARHLLRRARTPRVTGTRHLLFALCDHYEPLWGKAADDVGHARVDAWAKRYPALGRYRDSTGRPPRHGWFFPGEDYRAGFLDQLAGLVRGGFGEVEYHLHHDGDTAATLAPLIRGHLDLFAQHGHLSRGGDAPGGYRWAFIHGNWCLANGRPDGKWCGVNDEVARLHELGCYVDLTFPAAPDPSQPDQVNQLYWPTGDLTRRRAYDHGERARVGRAYDDRLLMITGPLALARKGRGIRIENGGLTGQDPPTPARVDSWVAQGIHVEGRPEWVFVKVYTHGAIEKTAASLLGDGAAALHDTLTRRYNDGARWKLHYVTAREMYNVARAAMDDRQGDPSGYYDYRIPPPPVAVR